MTMRRAALWLCPAVAAVVACMATGAQGFVFVGPGAAAPARGGAYRRSGCSSSSSSSSSSSAMASTMHKVTIEHEGAETVLEVDEQTTILEAALDAGIELPHDCKLGVCLTCPSKVVSGEVDQTDGTLEDSVTSQGYALTCATYPRSDCYIRSCDEDELVGAQFEREE